jgi:VCBS repeat-containing protein
VARPVDWDGDGTATADIGAHEAPANSAPTNITLDNNSVVENAPNGTLVGNLAVTDPDTGDSHTLSLVDNAGGRFQLAGAQLQVANGALLDFESSSSHNVTVRATDFVGATFDKVLTVNVTNVNEPPVNTLPVGPLTVTEDTDLVIGGVSLADPDAGGSDVTLTLSVLNGTLTVNTAVVGGLTPGDVVGNGTNNAVLTGTLAELTTTLADPAGLTYRGNLNYYGADTLTMLSNDQGNSGAGGPLTDTDSVGLAVTAVNDAPVVDLNGPAAGIDFAAPPHFEDAGPVLITDSVNLSVSDPDSASLASGTVTIANPLDGAAEALAANPSGTVISASYNPLSSVLTLTGPDTVAHFQQVLRTVTYRNTSQNPDTTTRSIAFVVTDGSVTPPGPLSSAVATSAVPLVAFNDPPTAVNDNLTATEDVPLVITVAADLLGNDLDPDGGPLVLTSVPATTAAGGSLVNGGATLTYTSPANYTGFDFFTYAVSDGRGGSDTAMVMLSVQPVNDGPVAGDDSATTIEDTPVTIAVLANDTDVDGDTLSVKPGGLVQGSRGIATLNPEGTITYTPNADDNGTDAFWYTVSDGNGGGGYGEGGGNDRPTQRQACGRQPDGKRRRGSGDAPGHYADRRRPGSRGGADSDLRDRHPAGRRHACFI